MPKIKVIVVEVFIFFKAKESEIKCFGFGFYFLNQRISDEVFIMEKAYLRTKTTTPGLFSFLFTYSITWTFTKEVIKMAVNTVPYKCGDTFLLLQCFFFSRISFLIPIILTVTIWTDSKC